MIGCSLLLIVVFSVLFDRTVYGKALRATAINRLGARLMGIPTEFAGKLSFFLCALIGAISGILIAPITTIYYDTGFLIGLKGFVAAIIGGLGKLSDRRSRRTAGRVDRIVFVVLGQRIQGSDRVHVDHSGAAVALAADASRGGRRMKRPSRSAWLGLALLLGLVAAPLVLSEFSITLLNYIGLASLVVLGLVLLTGVSGLTSFGQAAFVGLGAYTTAVLTTSTGLPSSVAWLGASPWLALFAGLMLTVAVASSVGISHVAAVRATTCRLARSHGESACTSCSAHRRCSADIPDAAACPQSRCSADRSNRGREIFYLIWAFVLAAVLTTRNLLDSREGRAIRALKGGRVMAEAMGVNTWASRMIAFVLAAMMACASGWLYAHMQRFVNPTPFSLHAGIEYLFMAVIGGASYVWGALLGASVLTVSNQWLRDWLPQIVGQAGNFETIVFGVLMIVILQRAPEGLWPAITRRIEWFAARPSIDRQPVSLKRANIATRGEKLLDVQSISKRFGGLVAVDQISLSAHAGEIVALIGPNGAGKTTVFNVVSGVLDATSGSVLFRGRNVTGTQSRDIAKAGSEPHVSACSIAAADERDRQRGDRRASARISWIGRRCGHWRVASRSVARIEVAERSRTTSRARRTCRAHVRFGWIAAVGQAAHARDCACAGVRSSAVAAR